MKTLRLIPLFVCMLVGLAGCLPTSLMKYPTITPVPQVAHVRENLVGIESVWVLNDVYIIWNEYDIAIDSLMGKTCFLGDLGKRGLYKNFICLESQSGQLLWIKETGVHRTIAVTLDGIFIAYSSPGALEKFDLNTGDLIWRKKLGGTGSTNLTYHKDQIQISTTNPEALWVLNTNAEIIRRIREGEHRIVLSTPDVTFVYLNGIQAFEADSKKVIWEHIDTQHLRQVPVFTEDKIFLRNGEAFSGTAYALDRISGELLWKSPNIVGNLVYSPGKHRVFALRENGDLLTIDENSGHEDVIAKFSPSPFLFFDGIDTTAYQLAYDPEEQMLIIYLGDSKQLFAFREK